jgi:hypothetical protein
VQIAAKQRLPTEELLFPMAEPYYFTYAFKEDLNIEYGFMGYAPLLRTLVMNDYTSTENYLDAVAFMHEMVHCIHAAFQRKHSMNAYLQFAHAEGNPRRVVINEEFDAYAVELEALNLLLDNEMLEASEKDAILNPDKVYEELHLRPEQKGPISMLCRLGLSYFKGSSIGNFSDEYTSHVARIQIAHGFDIYASDYRLIAKNKDYRHKT